jgi:hypothetical protein
VLRTYVSYCNLDLTRPVIPLSDGSAHQMNKRGLACLLACLPTWPKLVVSFASIVFVLLALFRPQRVALGPASRRRSLRGSRSTQEPTKSKPKTPSPFLQKAVANIVHRPIVIWSCNDPPILLVIPGLLSPVYSILHIELLLVRIRKPYRDKRDTSPATAEKWFFLVTLARTQLNYSSIGASLCLPIFYCL